MKKAKVKDVIREIEAIAPSRLAEPWDNCGLQFGDEEAEISSVFFCLDLDRRNIGEAIELGAELVVTHHPLIFEPVKSITPIATPAIYQAIKAGLNIYSAHTNYDNAAGGVSDIFAEKIGLTDLRPLRPVSADEPELGTGRAGRFKEPITLDALVEKIKSAFGLDHVRVIGASEGVITSGAVCGGSGSSLIDDAIAAGVDCYITGDLKYSNVRPVEGLGPMLIDIGHFAPEATAMPILAEKIKAALIRDGFEIKVSSSLKEEDPFKIA